MRRFGGIRLRAALLAAGVSVTLAPGAAFADDDDDGPSILDSVPAFAPIKQARDALADKGFTVSGFYFADPRGDFSGGMRRGTTYSGLLNVGLDVDFAKVAGIEGGKLHASMLQIHGKDVSEEYVGNILSANDIGARPTTRLFELWYEQKVTDRFTLRFGQMAADEEFMKAEYGGLFIDATFGWAGPPSENLPQGGPAYPLAAMGAQATFEATEDLTLVAAIYNGTTADPDAEDAEKANSHGLNFRVEDPPLVIAEGRYRYAVGGGEDGLPGMLKLGGYAHFGKFDDLKRGRDGLVLGAPGSDGEPRRHSGDVNLYAIVDQQIYKAPGGDDDAGVGVFARFIGGPSDRNEINLYVDGGVVASGLVPGRPADKIGLAVAYANFSPALADVDRATNAATGASAPIRDYEAVVEATYQAEIVPGLTVQPTLQYVWHPGGGVADPERDGTKRIRDAAVFGVVTVVRF